MTSIASESKATDSLIGTPKYGCHRGYQPYGCFSNAAQETCGQRCEERRPRRDPVDGKSDQVIRAEEANEPRDRRVPRDRSHTRANCQGRDRTRTELAERIARLEQAGARDRGNR